MKRIFTLLLLSLSFFVAKSQFIFSNGDTIQVLDSANATFTVVGGGYECRNTGTDTLTLRWQIIADSAVTGWTYTGFCDNNICYGYYVGESKAFTLAPGRNGLLEIHLVDACIPGNGYVKILLYNVADSAASVLQGYFNVTITPSASCTAGITDTKLTQTSFYPNPVRNELKVTLSQNLENGQIEIFNLIGSRVYAQPIGSRETIKEIDLSALESGLYVARISDNGIIISTKKFTKED